MVESLLTFAARELLKKVVTLLADKKLSLVCGFKNELATMHTTLVMLQAVEHLTQDQGDEVKIWVKEIEEIAGDVDDLLDDFGYEVLQCKVELQDQMKIKVLSIFDPIVFRHKMGRRIGNINESLVNLENQAASFHLVIADNATGDDDPEVDRQTAFCFDEDEKNIIGRGEVVSNIVTILINSNTTHQEKFLSVLAIVGMPGLGKTTVARSVYNDSEIGRHFQRKIWMCVSTAFEVEHILSEILGYLNAEKAALKGKDAILRNLQEDLEGKRYLLVLDDVWNEDLQRWDDLKTCLLSIRDTEGSNIIVTTRNVKVAKIMETLPRYDLTRLSNDECWLILQNKAASSRSTLPHDQERIGKEIAEKCGGVPLVAKILGSLMRSKDSKEWLGIEKSPMWDLKNESNRIFAVLNFSFSELNTPSLKKCFAYCSTFTKDFNMEKHDLIQHWMAMGLLEYPSQKGTQEEMEDIGNAYFCTLLENSLFQDVTKDTYGIITHCKMHDLVHDLAEHVSQSMCLTRYSNKIPKVEHTSMQQRILKGSVQKLFMNDEIIGRLLPGFNTLRILKLYKADIVELPDSIGKLKHLRYLDVSRTKMKLLPKSIGKLYYLQTLRMFPVNPLQEIPKELQNLINLRHLYFDHRLQFPAGMSQLTNLRSLTHFRVSKEIGHGIEELFKLSKLEGDLSIYNLEHVRNGEEAQKANLAEKTNIRRLKYEWSQTGGWLNSTNDEDVLEGLQPHSNLEFLEIHGFKGERFPLWMMSRLFLLNNNLKEIELVDCNTCEGLPILGHLPNLRHVRIDTMRNLKCVGYEFYGYEQVHQAAATSEETKALFPALKTLHIENAGNLTEWMEAAVLTTERLVVFPCLEELTLKSCFSLRSAPTHFPSLKKLVIKAMNSSMPMESIISNKFTTLTHLEICSVRRLTCLPDGMLGKNKNLAYLKIQNCSEFTCIAHDGFEYCCTSLESLFIWWCGKLTYLPDGILTPSLKNMSVMFCANLKSIPDLSHGGCFSSLQILSIQHCPQLSSLPKGLEYCISLEKMEIQKCSKLSSIPMTQGQPLLRELYIRDCPQLSSSPSGLEYCTSLQKLHITGCRKITSISINSSLSTSLQDICVSHLESLPTLQGFTFLRRLQILECTSAQIGPDFSASLQTLVSLQELRISCCPNAETIPNLEKLTSLSLLQISYCYRLTSLPSLVGLHCLKKLEIGRFWEELESFPAFPRLPQLKALTIDGWPKLKRFPDQIQYMTSLWVFSFDGVVAFPDWLGNLASLEKLTIQDCQNLMYLPSVKAMQRLTKLHTLSIIACPLLRERCTRKSGPEWPKIRLVPFLYSGGMHHSLKLHMRHIKNKR